LGFFVENMPSGNPESIATENCAWQSLLPEMSSRLISFRLEI
jgi:hypothetical protein